MAANNEDFLTQVQRTAVATLAAAEYFTPTDGGRPIPILAELDEDIQTVIRKADTRGVVCTISVADFSVRDLGGCLTGNGSVVVKVMENIPANRSSSGTQENAARVASMVALTLNGTHAAKREDGVSMGGGLLKFDTMTPGIAQDSDGRPVATLKAYDVRFTFANGTILPFTRRNNAPPAGAP